MILIVLYIYIHFR